MGFVTVAGVIWAVALVTGALGASDLTSAGIAGSYAGMMPYAAVANGEGAASLMAVLQSAGMAGLFGSAEVLASVSNGGGVAAKSLVNGLQSAGIVDLSATAAEVLASVANGGGVAAKSLVNGLHSAGMDFLSGTATKTLASVSNKARSLMDVLQSTDHVHYFCELDQPLHKCIADMAAQHKGLLTTAVAVTAGAAGAVVLVPIALNAAGFTSAGIAAGSIGAKMMSITAIANGGGVPAGSLVAILQSAGAAGLSGTATAVVAGAGGVVGYLVTLI